MLFTRMPTLLICNFLHTCPVTSKEKKTEFYPHRALLTMNLKLFYSMKLAEGNLKMLRIPSQSYSTILFFRKIYKCFNYRHYFSFIDSIESMRILVLAFQVIFSSMYQYLNGGQNVKIVEHIM